MSNGYKQTELGVIPKDWNIESLNRCVRSDAPICYGILMPGQHVAGGIPVVKVKDIAGGRVDESELLLTHPSIDHAYRRSRLLPGDILITIRGTTGRIAIVSETLRGANITQDTARVRVGSNQVSRFLYVALQAQAVQSQIALHTIGQAVKGINIRDVKNISIPLPPTKQEQEAIADALSDMDTLIECLEQLLAKKRLIKQGVMQELLTGRRRLSGFQVHAGYKHTDIGLIPKDWDLKSLDSIAIVTSGKRLPLGTSLTEHETPYPYIRVADMKPGTVSLNKIQYVPPEVFPAIKHYRIYKDDLFISVAGTLGIVGKIPPELNGANLTENADRITDIKCSQDYLLHLMMAPQIQNTIESLRTVGAQPKLALERIRKFSIPVPSDRREQDAIAKTINELGEEVSTLESRVEKCRVLKQGMMQQLLTGKIRLI